MILYWTGTFELIGKVVGIDFENDLAFIEVMNKWTIGMSPWCYYGKVIVKQGDLCAVEHASNAATNHLGAIVRVESNIWFHRE